MRFGALVLRRGMRGASDWYEWWARTRHAADESRRRVTIVVMGHAGADLQRWTFADAALRWPMPSRRLSAASAQPLIETLELSVGDSAEFAGR